MAISNLRVLAGDPEPVTEVRAFAYLSLHNGGKLTTAERLEIVQAVWSIGQVWHIRPGIAFAQMCHETADFTFPGQVPITKRNPAGIGATNDGAPGLQYPSWSAGIMGYYVHLVAWLGGPAVVPAATQFYNTQIDPRLPLVERVRAVKGPVVTWADLGGRWAVPGDGYGAALDRKYAAILATEGATKMVHLVISSGHHNTDGGNALEYQQTGELTEAVARWARTFGLRVTVLTPDGPDADADPGDGTLNMGLQSVAQKVVDLDKSDPVDAYLETHTEGGGTVGVFSIYPDAPGDTDTDVRDKLGPAISRAVAAATGLAVRRAGRDGIPGVTSEQETGVGAAGDRLGIFLRTAPIRDHCTRWITEYGAHDKEPDVTIQRSPGFYEKAGRATAEEIALFYGLKTNVTPDPVPAGPDVPSRALRAYFDTLPEWYRGDLSNTTFYEADVNFSGIYPAIQGWQRAIFWEYGGAWFAPDGTVFAIRPSDTVSLHANGMVRRR